MDKAHKTNKQNTALIRKMCNSYTEGYIRDIMMVKHDDRLITLQDNDSNSAERNRRIIWMK